MRENAPSKSALSLSLLRALKSHVRGRLKLDEIKPRSKALMQLAFNRYESQAKLNATAVGAIGKKMTNAGVRFSPEGHQAMAPYAREADLASLR